MHKKSNRTYFVPTTLVANEVIELFAIPLFRVERGANRNLSQLSHTGSQGIIRS